jgi:GntR family transcriptional regulator/MocR family aminotransferase
VRTAPERLVVCSGFAQGLSLLSRILRGDGVRTLPVESYGLHVHRDLAAASGLSTIPLTVDQFGADTAQLTTHRHSSAVLLTPAHQFPTGVPLHPDRRAAAVDWARTTDGLVLEDDYDGEFRYDRQPVGALQGLDPERVVYLGTASKSLAPGLRLGWMALPEHLVEQVVTAKHAGERHPSVLDQLTLAEFITSGGYDRHLRAMRLRYRRRRDRMVAALAERVPSVQVSGIAAGCTRCCGCRRGRSSRCCAAPTGWVWPSRAWTPSGIPLSPGPRRRTASSSVTGPRPNTLSPERWTPCARCWSRWPERLPTVDSRRSAATSD